MKTNWMIMNNNQAYCIDINSLLSPWGQRGTVQIQDALKSENRAMSRQWKCTEQVMVIC